MKIIVSDEADNDLLLIFSYLSQNSSQAAAELFASEIDRCLANVSAFPFSGSPRPRLGPDIRGVVVLPYLILYAVRSDHITILRVLHGSRNIDAEFHR
jgi:toxin ParE1/3/4